MAPQVNVTVPSGQTNVWGGGFEHTGLQAPIIISTTFPTSGSKQEPGALRRDHTQDIAEPRQGLRSTCLCGFCPPGRAAAPPGRHWTAPSIKGVIAWMCVGKRLWWQACPGVPPHLAPFLPLPPRGQTQKRAPGPGGTWSLAAVMATHSTNTPGPRQPPDSGVSGQPCPTQVRVPGKGTETAALEPHREEWGGLDRTKREGSLSPRGVQGDGNEGHSESAQKGPRHRPPTVHTV